MTQKTTDITNKQWYGNTFRPNITLGQNGTFGSAEGEEVSTERTIGEE